MLRLLLLTATLGLANIQAQHATVAEAVEQVHSEVWRTLVDQWGLIHDYVGELPTPEDCSLGRPNAIGWWSPIEDGPMFTGIYLAAACERARRTGAAQDRDSARKLAAGLIKCASVSDVPGMIVRGIGSDGRCHYPLGSDDQTHPWFYGLHAYFKSTIPSPAEREKIAAKMTEVADVLQSTGWQCPCDGAFKGQFRGGFTGHLFRDAARYLFMLRAMHDVTGDPAWLDRYRKALDEHPTKEGGTRGDICALGYPQDREAIKHLDDYQMWIYVGSQASLAGLAAMEKKPDLRAPFLKGLAVNATNAMPNIGAFRQFDNNDTKVFGTANWRAVHKVWYPQPTQADAAKLSETGDPKLKGERKHYEARFMRNPLAAAAIVALKGDGDGREEIEAAIRHYDYTRLHMGERSFAEAAFYALSETPK